MGNGSEMADLEPWNLGGGSWNLGILDVCSAEAHDEMNSQLTDSPEKLPSKPVGGGLES